MCLRIFQKFSENDILSTHLLYAKPDVTIYDIYMLFIVFIADLPVVRFT